VKAQRAHTRSLTGNSPMASSRCKATDCQLDSAAKGYCHLHYNRWKRHGDPNQAHRMVPRGSSLSSRIELLRKPGSANECWEWQGSIHHTGYGIMKFDGKHKYAHQWAYIEQHGEIPDGLQVLHSCDNRRCVNPNHLRAGTHQDNMDDKVERDRCARLLGELGPSRKITESEAVEIIQRYATESISSAALGKDYGISPSQVQNIVNGKRWPHLDRANILKGIK